MKNSEINKENLGWLISQPIDVQYELFKSFVDISKLHYNNLVSEELKIKAGSKYERGKRYSRWGSNPGSIRIGEEKVPVEVPRLYDKVNEKTESPEYYQKLHTIPLPQYEVIKKVIKGLSQKDNEEVTKSVIESFGLSQSTISRSFKEESSKLLDEFEKRDLGNYDFIVLILYGKYLSTENTFAIKGLLKKLIDRNFNFTEGILTIVDGSKGLNKAVDEVFGEFTLTQCCQ